MVVYRMIKLVSETGDDGSNVTVRKDQYKYALGNECDRTYVYPSVIFENIWWNYMTPAWGLLEYHMIPFYGNVKRYL